MKEKLPLLRLELVLVCMPEHWKHVTLFTLYQAEQESTY